MSMQLLQAIFSFCPLPPLFCTYSYLVLFLTSIFLRLVVFCSKNKCKAVASLLQFYTICIFSFSPMWMQSCLIFMSLFPCLGHLENLSSSLSRNPSWLCVGLSVICGMPIIVFIYFILWSFVNSNRPPALSLVWEYLKVSFSSYRLDNIAVISSSLQVFLFDPLMFTFNENVFMKYWINILVNWQ